MRAPLPVPTGRLGSAASLCRSLVTTVRLSAQIADPFDPRNTNAKCELPRVHDPGRVPAGASRACRQAVILTDGKAGTVENVSLDELHGLRICIRGPDWEWPMPPPAVLAN